MAMALTEMYGLTTEDALQAFREQRLDLLAAGNRWKPFLLDHVAGVHDGRSGQYERVCLVCRNDGQADVATSSDRA
jgi:hypothetical protein